METTLLKQMMTELTSRGLTYAKVATPWNQHAENLRGAVSSSFCGTIHMLQYKVKKAVDYLLIDEAGRHWRGAVALPAQTEAVVASYEIHHHGRLQAVATGQ